MAEEVLVFDPYERANARLWAKFIDEKCFPAILKACWGEDQKEREKAAEELSELLQFLENELKGKRYFGGETIGLLDIAANMISYWLGISEEASGASELLTREKFPKLFNWANEFVSETVQRLTWMHLDKARYWSVFHPGDGEYISIHLVFNNSPKRKVILTSGKHKM
nr:glutathione s-transferase u8 [Quercus suber]